METYNFFHFFFFRPHTFYSPTSSQKIKIFLTFIRNGQKSVRTEIRARDKDLSPSLSSSIHVLHANKSFPCIYFLFLPFNSLMHVMIYKMFTFRQKLSRGESGNEPPLIGAAFLHPFPYRINSLETCRQRKCVRPKKISSNHYCHYFLQLALFVSTAFAFFFFFFRGV